MRPSPESDERIRETSFSAKRATKLFALAIGISLLWGIPQIIIPLAIKSQQEEKAKREKMQKLAVGLQRAADEGQLGEAGQRLFGIESRPSNKEKQTSK